MIKLLKLSKALVIVLLAALCLPRPATAQTDLDGIMMARKNICSGFMYGYSTWGKYWEGTLKRDNQNIGTYSSQMVAFMSTYGITSSINAMVMLPYVSTHVTEGTLHGLNGLQDISLWLKWRAYSTSVGKGRIAFFALGGFSTPASNYEADFQPMSIGLHSTTWSGRILVDYLLNKFFVTGSATYTYRNNITVDRTAYYTTNMHLTNEVEMPDVTFFNIRAGYRSKNLTAEAVASKMTTLGGFDIRRDDFPFPSNKMNATTAGVNLKYFLSAVPGLSVNAGANYVLAGRNVGQATSVEAGVFYILDFSSKSKTKSK